MWCRVAAAVIRITQSTYPAGRGRLSCFVDDPLLSVRGDRQTRDILIVQTLALLLALRTKFSWGKASRGIKVQWIGACVEIGPGKVVVTIPAEKIEAIEKTIEAMLTGKGMVYRADVRRLAGKCSWIGGLLPQLKPFVRSLWGAISKEGPRKQANLIFVKQIRPALVWLRRFAAGCHGGLVREHWLCARYAEGVVIQTDASLWGGGSHLLGQVRRILEGRTPR